MPLPLEYNLPKTQNSSEFEDMVCDVCTRKYGRSFQRYGRSGQKQSGIDIISVGQEKQIGIQCKNYEISIKEIDRIVEEAKKFRQSMVEFIIATSSFRDVKLQEYITKINQGDEEKLNFMVSILFWEEISMTISQNKDLLVKYYPVFNEDPIERLVGEFNCLINKYCILDYVKEDPTVGIPKYYPELVDSFVGEARQALSRENALQRHPRFAAMNHFTDTLYNYSGYLGMKLFSANTMYTIQNPYDKEDITSGDSKIKKKIEQYKTELEQDYGKINPNCSMFFVGCTDL